MNYNSFLSNINIHDARIHEIKYNNGNLIIVISLFKGNDNPYSSKSELLFNNVQSFAIEYGDAIGFEWSVLDLTVTTLEDISIKVDVLVSDMSSITVICESVDYNDN